VTRLRRWLGRAVVGLVGLVAVAMIAFRTAAAIRERQTNRSAAPPSGRLIRSVDADLFVQEEGPADGPPVLFIHGTGAWSEIWRGSMRTIAARGYRAIAVDLPPFGFSSRPQPADYRDDAQGRRIIGLLDAMGIQNVTLVGHSFGARPTMQATFLAAGRVRALVLVDAALGLSAATTARQPPWPIRAILAAAPVRDAAVAATLTNPWMTRRLLSMLISEKAAATPERVAMLQRPFVVDGTTARFGEWLRAFVTVNDRSLANQSESYASLRMPTLVLWGERDSLTPVDQGRHIASLIPGARVVVLPRAGHIPAIEDPAGFDSALVGFLAGAVPLQPQNAKR
jgi:pimeloyl-ACP methyl ester carboxylesterase